MKVNKILLLSVFAITFFINVEACAGAILYAKNSSIIQTKPVRHWYLGGFLGTNLSTSGDTRIPSILSKPSLTSEPVYDRGYVLGLNVGYRFHHSFRIEGELAYQNLPMNKIRDAIGQGITTNVRDSQTRLFSLFVNGYYDFRLFQRWMPYFGLGVGYVEVNNTIKPVSPVPVGPGLFFTKKTLNYNTFGYQGMLGVQYQLTQNVALELNYKYFSTFEAKTRGRTNLGPDGYKTKQTIINNMISFGVRCFFN